MQHYIARRLILNVFVVWAVMSFVFFAVRVLPGDYATTQVATKYFGGGAATGESADDALKKARQALGLDQSLPRQYLHFWTNLFTGDLGHSFVSRRSVTGEVAHALPYSLQLGAMTMLVALVAAIPVGIVCAVWQDSLVDAILRPISIGALAAPSFWLATMGTLVVLRYDILTLDIVESPGIWENPWRSLQLFIIPAMAGGIAAGAVIMRMLRSQILDVLRQDYVRTARSKGLRGGTIIGRHVIKNAVIPVLTVASFMVTGMVSGSVILEYMFNIPGMGRLLLESLQKRDTPMVEGMALVIAIFVVFVNLLIDLAYFKLDPRINLADSNS